MKTVYSVSIACMILATTIAAGLQFGVPWRLPDDWVATFALVPLALAIIAIFRAPRTTVPSWLIFACGIAMDTLSQGVLGYWALTYTACTLLARLVPSWLNRGLASRICAHAALSLFVFILHISLNWIGLLGEPAWMEVARSALRMFIFSASVEVALAFLARLSFQLEGFGNLAHPDSRKR